MVLSRYAGSLYYGLDQIIIMRRASEASLFVLGFPRKKKPLHNGSYEHRVPKIKKQNIILYTFLCV